MVNSPLRPYLLGGWLWGGTLDSHDFLLGSNGDSQPGDFANECHDETIPGSILIAKMLQFSGF